MHDEMEHNYEIVSDWDTVPEGRLLADTYGPLRIIADYSLFTGASAETKDYIQNKLMPAAINYFSKALQVPQLSSFVLTDSTSCGLKIPSIYKSGVQADLLLLVTGESSSESWVAWAGSCKLLKSTNRPIVGQVNFNYKDIKAEGDIQFENDLYSVLHEIAHVLGFSDSLFNKFVKPAKTGTINANGVSYSYVDVEPLTTRLRNHFNCPTLVGAFMENSGGSGSAGSHFERTTFSVEIMTASEIADTRFSEFTLALLEGTGWYKVNYDMAEPFHWGRGKGCSFLSSCSTNFPEYCSGGGDACTFHGRNGGYCASDSFGDKCNAVKGYTNVDCEDPTAQKGATLNAEKYPAGSRCFAGTLYSSGSLSSTRTYCFSYNCAAQAGGKFDLTINVGSAQAKCLQKGAVSVSGYKGTINCPDPQEYCSTVGAPFCKRGCMGTGTCVSGKCYCDDGWTGADCSTKCPTCRSTLPPPTTTTPSTGTTTPSTGTTTPSTGTTTPSTGTTTPSTPSTGTTTPSTGTTTPSTGTTTPSTPSTGTTTPSTGTTTPSTGGTTGSGNTGTTTPSTGGTGSTTPSTGGSDTGSGSTNSGNSGSNSGSGSTTKPTTPSGTGNSGNTGKNGGKKKDNYPPYCRPLTFTRPKKS